MPEEGVREVQPAAVVQAGAYFGEVVDQDVAYRARRNAVPVEQTRGVMLAAVAVGRPHRPQRGRLRRERTELHQQLPHQVLAPVTARRLHQVGVVEQVFPGELPQSLARPDKDPTMHASASAWSRGTCLRGISASSSIEVKGVESR
jgi:hypothetical protein